jgi:hypothetical protein
MTDGVVEEEGLRFGVKNCIKKEGNQENSYKKLVIWLLTILSIHHRLPE